jgi:hypothetical protein
MFLRTLLGTLTFFRQWWNSVNEHLVIESAICLFSICSENLFNLLTTTTSGDPPSISPASVGFSFLHGFANDDYLHCSLTWREEKKFSNEVEAGQLSSFRFANIVLELSGEKNSLYCVSVLSEALSQKLTPRVARFFSVHDTKKGKKEPDEHKMYQLVIKYPKCIWNIPNRHKVNQHFPI